MSGTHQITVLAGDFARHHCIVSFALPGQPAGTFSLRDAAGATLPLQVSADGNAVFVLPELAAQQTRSYTLEPGSLASPSGASSVVKREAVTLSVGASKVLQFRTKGAVPGGVDAVYQRGGYVHPLYSPAGLTLTDDYPTDHRHHHGVWSAWTRTQFGGHAVDFWNMADKLGKVDFDSLLGTWQGAVHAGFTANLVHMDVVGPAPVTALTERWTVTAYKTHESAPPYLIWDLESIQRADTAPLALEQYTYGGFGARGAADWQTKADATFLTSEGLDRIAGDGSSARWVYLGGRVGEGRGGFAVLGHPQNFRAPQPLRLHPDDPYASLSPVKAGAFEIAPAADYVTRLRFVSADGAPDATLLEALWHDYATPPLVMVE